MPVTVCVCVQSCIVNSRTLRSESFLSSRDSTIFEFLFLRLYEVVNFCVTNFHETVWNFVYLWLCAFS